MGVTTLMAACYIATQVVAVVATNAVPAAERFVCRRMRLGAVFERANPSAFLTYCLEHHFDSTHIVLHITSSTKLKVPSRGPVAHSH